MKALFLFIDGFGLAPAAADNPINREVCPALCRLIAEQSTPIDACLGVPGLPQSATGQATLFTGENAAAWMGRHVEGFPGPSLRKLVEARNVLLALSLADCHCRFADAYMADTIDEVRGRRHRSVTTTAVLTRPETACFRRDLLTNQAVCHDITRESLAARGYSGPVIRPEDAAQHLVQIALGFDFTLFEFFLSDRAGHSGNMDEAVRILRMLDAFAATVWQLARETGMLLVITSDHGNIEAMNSHGHTTNPVPLVASGPGAEVLLQSATSLMDVTPRLMRLLAPNAPPLPLPDAGSLYQA